MIRPPPRSTRTATLVPYTTLVLSDPSLIGGGHLRLATAEYLLHRVREYAELRTCAMKANNDGMLVGAGILVFVADDYRKPARSEEHTSELQSLMRISYAVFCLKQKTQT